MVVWWSESRPEPEIAGSGIGQSAGKGGWGHLPLRSTSSLYLYAAVYTGHLSFLRLLCSVTEFARMGRITGRLFVAFTLLLICFISYSSQIFVIWPWYGRVLSVELITLLLPFK